MAITSASPHNKRMCNQGRNVTNEKHRMLEKDLISGNFQNANEKKARQMETVCNTSL